MIDNIPSIKIFACDYRNITGKWDLPFIRLGDLHSNAVINIGKDIENNKYMPAMSELDKIWWVAKHIEEFGKTDYVGFCHYRRFFTHAFKNPVTDIPEKEFNVNQILTPEQELVLIVNAAAVGCSLLPLQVTPPGTGPIWDQIYSLDKNMPRDVNKRLFDIYLRKAPVRLRSFIEKAMFAEQQYLCNIFTLRRDLFIELSDMMFPTMVDFDNWLDLDVKKEMHPRYLGYYAERLISVYLHALQLSGMKLLHLPLLTVDCWKHNRVVKDENGVNVEVLAECGG